MRDNWSACLQTLEGHSGSVESVIFSHDSKLVASASYDKTVKIWDATNGHCLQTLEGHSGWIYSAVFSHDSKLVASASYDKTVKIWDASSGHCLQTLEGHSDSVKSVIFSHNSKLVASASRDKTVKIWDATNGHHLQTVNAGRSVRVKSFDLTTSYLELNCGTIRLSLGSPAIPAEAPKFSACGIGSDDTWITWDTGNLLWLPPEYRPRVSNEYEPRVSDATTSAICIGCTSGRVLIFKVDPQQLSHSKNNPWIFS